MTKKVKRVIVYYTDDETDLFNELTARRLRGENDLAAATVRQMLDPPKTAYKFILFRVIED